MVYFETGKFKRDTVNREGKPTKTVRVTGLSVNSKFDNNEELSILSKADFTEMETQLNTNIEKVKELENQVKTKDDKIRELETQLKQANTEIETLKNTPPEPIPESPKYINKVIDLQEEINNRNKLLMNTQNTINNIFTEVNQNQTQNLTNLIGLISELQTTAKTILDYGDEIRNQKDGINSSIDKTNIIKWTFSKNKFKIVLDMDILTELEAEIVKFTNTDIVQLANTVITPVEIPTDKLDLNELYISIDTEDSSNEPIPSKVITPDKE